MFINKLSLFTCYIVGVTVYFRDFPNLRIPFYPVFGNHDYGYGKTGLNAQIDRYARRIDADGLWRFQGTNYSKVFPLPGGDGSVYIGR